MEKSLIISVHQLVDFLLRSGDIDERVFNRSSMQEGSRIHSSYQAKQSENYMSEYPLRRTFSVSDILVTLEGRADGIIKKSNGEFIIDEIKSTVIDLKEFYEENLDWHLGQAKCYALMFVLEQNLSFIHVRLTYIRQGKEKDKRIEEFTFSKEELEQYVLSLIEDYLDFYNIIFTFQKERADTIKTLNFPFDNFRKGQREVAKYAYSIAKSGGKLFVEAPTGIGKTMSMIFPFLKALGEDDEAKLFYLTAKTPGKEAAYNAIELLKAKGLKLKDLVITAKEKICLNDKCNCNPDECPFAQGYYSKIQGVLKYALLNYSTFDLKTILSLSKENQICPFEFQLDLSLFCDAIICDYNYLFDPISYLKRFFDQDSSHCLALIDETHNLIDRSKEMHSSSISEYKFEKAKKSLRHVKNTSLKNQLRKISKLFIEFKECYLEENNVVENFDDDTYKIFTSFTNFYTDFSKNNHKLLTSELTDFYLDVNRFLKISELFSDKFMAYFERKDDFINLHIQCLDASHFIGRISDSIKASVFFSATMSPMNYYVDTLGGKFDMDPHLILQSPFNKDHLKILIAPKVSIKYKNRATSYVQVAEYIKSFISSKIGNYFIYSPSYEYMNNLLDCLELTDDFNAFVQEKEMSDLEKKQFLDKFAPNPEKTTLGFLVLGGAFSEGIDLISDRLIGAVIIGIGMPKINFVSDTIAEYYKAQEKPGYDYAYLNPGMNKVQQAVGRVIRSEDDIGAVLLIDERYMYNQYKDLFRTEWTDYQVVYTPDEVKKTLDKFFSK